MDFQPWNKMLGSSDRKRQNFECIYRPRSSILNWQVFAKAHIIYIDLMRSKAFQTIVQPPVKHRNSKWWSVSSLTVIEYSSDKQMFWSVCTYSQAGLSLCWSHIPHSWKYHVIAHIYVSWSTSELRVRLVPLNWLKSSSNSIFLWLFQGGASFMDRFW